MYDKAFHLTLIFSLIIRRYALTNKKYEILQSKYEDLARLSQGLREDLSNREDDMKEMLNEFEPLKSVRVSIFDI